MNDTRITYSNLPQKTKGIKDELDKLKEDFKNIPKPKEEIGYTGIITLETLENFTVKNGIIQTVKTKKI